MSIGSDRDRGLKRVGRRDAASHVACRARQAGHDHGFIGHLLRLESIMYVQTFRRSKISPQISSLKNRWTGPSKGMPMAQPNPARPPLRLVSVVVPARAAYR